MGEWQPIETCPQIEGVYYLGYDEITAEVMADPDAGVCVIQWMDADDDYPAEWQVQPICGGLEVIISETRVTRWMPIPKAPVKP